ncbi:MAG: MFS transporter [Burkholderiales bacterium]
MSDAPTAAAPRTFPLWPLLATLATQTLATMAAYSLPALAPMVAAELRVDGALIGYFVSVVYGVGIGSSLLAAGFIHRHGAVRACQFVLVATLAMLLIAAQGGLAAVALGAVAIGIGYGATAPAATHLLVPRTPPRIMNLVLSIRQIGVPLGGVLGALLLPPVALALGWQNALLVQAVPVVLLLVLLEWPRRSWERQAPAPGTRVSLAAGLRQPFALLASPAIARLTYASFIFSGTQLCFIAFMTVHLTSRAGFELIAAGQALATYQLSGVLSRPLWGWIADNFMPARRLLVLQGFIMAAAALVAGQFGAGTPGWLVLLVCVAAGSTASGYTGIAYGEFARLGGTRRTEATGLGSSAMFAGVLVLPALATVVVTTLDSYAIAYGAVALLALSASAVLLLRAPRA